MKLFRHNHNTMLNAALWAGVSVFIWTSAAWASQQDTAALPAPGEMVRTTDRYQPPLIAGMTVRVDNPLRFDFLIDTGEQTLTGSALQEESLAMIRYFMTALTLPEDDLWVNLSPYEAGRVIPDAFGRTRMGRELLAQDYLLKQLTATLMYPEEALGRAFWERVYRRAWEEYGVRDLPAKTFNKVWIVPEAAAVHVDGQTVWVTESRLRVMLEEDYVALARQAGGEPSVEVPRLSGIAAQVVREVLIPEIEQEVNSGRTFAKLRQIFQSVILATWYKQNLRESLLGRVYADRARVVGIAPVASTEIQNIYDRYVRAFERGVYDFIREDEDPATRGKIPRRYYSGGAYLATAVRDSAAANLPARVVRLTTDFRAVTTDAAILADPLSTETDEAVNFLKGSALAADLQGFLRETAGPQTDFGRWLAQWKTEGARSFQNYRAFVSGLGRQTGITGPVIYNPFGGMDAVTGFLITEEAAAERRATDVITFGLDHFGMPDKLVSYLDEFRARVAADPQGMAGHPFLKYEGFDDYYQFYLSEKDKGLGLAALLRIMLLLDGDVEGLYYFDMLPGTGGPRFLTPEELAQREPEEYGPSVMVAFRDPVDGQRKRFWYLHTHISLKDRGFEAFADRLRADGLLLKATFEDNLSERSAMIYRKVLAPVIRGRGRVVADVLKNNAPAVIWRDDVPPREWVNTSEFLFGYTYPGYPVAYGDADQLYVWQTDEGGRGNPRPDDSDDQAVLSEEDPYGGIDLNAGLVNLRVTEGIHGMRFAAVPPGWEERVPAGFVPVIVRIEPSVAVADLTAVGDSNGGSGADFEQ